MTSDDGELLGGGKRLVEAVSERAERRGHFRQEGERRAPRRRHLAETGMKGCDEPQDVRASPPAESSRTLSADGSHGPRWSGMGEVVLSSLATPLSQTQFSGCVHIPTSACGYSAVLSIYIASWREMNYIPVGFSVPYN